jgi:arylsulfatase A-like enzyme
MKSKKRQITRRAFTAAPLLAFGSAGAQGAAGYNVLMIVVDDLRADFGCYGNTLVATPHLDALAARATMFTRAYCQHALCSPSRSSFMTGCRPDTTGIYNLTTHFRLHLPDVVTLPQQFRNNGYVTSGFSKVYHYGLDDSRSWSTPSYFPDGPPWGTPENAERSAMLDQQLIASGWQIAPEPPPPGPSWEILESSDEDMPDGKTVTTLINALYVWRGRPFFLAAGFLKPHLPFSVPAEYFDLYPDSKMSAMPRDYPIPPGDVPADAMHLSTELRLYDDIPDSGPIPDDKALQLTRAYYASISFLDAQIGRVLAALDQLGLRERTIVVVTSDHGYHLGEHALWTKHTNFERATRVPLIMSVPGQAYPGVSCSALTELVDLYPTLCELCGVPRPAGLEGSSFALIFSDPANSSKQAAFSQYSRPLDEPPGRSMGYSVRTKRFRFTEWRAAPLWFPPSPNTPPGSLLRGLELYDYLLDPKESVNHANQSAYASVVNSLTSLLRAGWTYAR